MLRNVVIEYEVSLFFPTGFSHTPKTIQLGSNRYQHLGDPWSMGVTKGRASLEAYSFLKYVLRKCENTPKILVDGGPWYKPALERLHIEWEHITFSLRNPIEQWFFLLKHRIKLFYRNWSYHTTVDSTQQ